LYARIAIVEEKFPHSFARTLRPHHERAFDEILIAEV